MTLHKFAWKYYENKLIVNALSVIICAIIIFGFFLKIGFYICEFDKISKYLLMSNSTCNWLNLKDKISKYNTTDNSQCNRWTKIIWKGKLNFWSWHHRPFLHVAYFNQLKY